MGLKFDARYAVFLTLPLAIVLLIPPLERRVASPLRPNRLRQGLCIVESLLFAGAALVYALDFGFFFYLQQRLDMTALSFLEDPLISAAMLWESYPLIPLTLAYGLSVAGYGWLVSRGLRAHTPVPIRKQGRGDGATSQEGGISRRSRVVLTAVILVGLFVAGYGQISSNLFPLRWSNAYFSQDRYIAVLALNPLQNLYDTRKFGQAGQPDTAAAQEAYPRMAHWLRLPPDNPPMSFVRQVPGSGASGDHGRPLNVVIIIMESMTWPRSSFAPAMPDGSHLDATPFLRELAEHSRYFPNFFAPTRTTARAVFTTISGIPDVNHSGGTTSRNPVLVDQNTVLSQFTGYEKYYMIGGSASWANIRGLLQYNVPGLHLLEEGAWDAPNIDVWGISDLALFKEATQQLSAGDEPFVACIQTAAFHRPYTIPEDNDGYVRPPSPLPQALAWYGFESEQEYVSMHFSDYALRRFFHYASQEPWFNDTVFAIFGDHGLNNRSNNVSPGYLACELQAWHIPLLIYAPGRVEPGVNPHPYMQPDVLVTMAALAGIDITTTTLGRNMLEPDNDSDAVAFISFGDAYRSLVKDGYCFTMGSKDALYDLAASDLNNLIDAEPERAACMKRQALDFYHTSKYLLFNNSKKILTDSVP